MKRLNANTKTLIRWGVAIILLIPLGYTIYKHWANVRDTFFAADWHSVFLGTFLLIAAQPILVLIARVNLKQLGHDLPYKRIFYIYFVSLAAKYLPGGVWGFPGRVVAYQTIGVKGLAPFISLIREEGMLFISAALVGLAGLLDGLRIANWIRISIALGTFVCIALMLLVQIPGIWRALGRIKFLNTSGFSEIQLVQENGSYQWLLRTLLLGLFFWVLIGFGFREMASGVSNLVKDLNGFQIIGIFALAWCAGYVIVIAPAGIGIRESVLSALLASYMPVAQALSIALMARLWWSIGEAGFIFLSMLKVSASGFQTNKG